MNIPKTWLEEKKACKNGIAYFVEKGLEGKNIIEVLELLKEK